MVVWSAAPKEPTTKEDAALGHHHQRDGAGTNPAITMLPVLPTFCPHSYGTTWANPVQRGTNNIHARNPEPQQTQRKTPLRHASRKQRETGAQGVRIPHRPPRGAAEYQRLSLVLTQSTSSCPHPAHIPRTPCRCAPPRRPGRRRTDPRTRPESSPPTCARACAAAPSR